MGWYGLDSFSSGEGSMEDSCEHGTEPSVSIKYWETVEYHSDWRLLKKDSAPWSYLVSY
jgi:hypothetical protein